MYDSNSKFKESVYSQNELKKILFCIESKEKPANFFNHAETINVFHNATIGEVGSKAVYQPLTGKKRAFSKKSDRFICRKRYENR